MIVWLKLALIHATSLWGSSGHLTMGQSSEVQHHILSRLGDLFTTQAVRTYAFQLTHMSHSDTVVSGG